ncbi:MAG: hypothetical protein KF713_10610 [Turneriella sp.]|nr:hypothetical protein [Turneriella sp.]
MKRVLYIFLAALSTQACVGKFLSTLLSTENAQFKLIEVTPVANTKILVSFNKPLDYAKGALELANYSVPGLNLSSVTKGPETHQVYLLLDPSDTVRMQRQYYTLTVGTIKNLYLDELLPGAENRSRQFMGARWLRATCIDDAGAFTCPVSATTSGTPYTVTVRGDYAKGSNYRWALYNITTSSYHFAQSAITPVANTFSVPAGLPTAEYRLELIIQDDSGAWQPASDMTQYFFAVDNTSVSNIALKNTPPSLTSLTVTNISIVYRNCVDIPGGFPSGYAAPCYSAASPVSDQIPASYKYRVGTKPGAVASDCNGATTTYTYGSWSASRSTNLPINEILSVNQCYNIQVVAADNVGNYQCDTTLADGSAGACTNPAGPASGSITDFFTTKSYQETRFLLDTVAPTAAFNNNTLPVATTSATSFAIEVDATGLSKYQYRVIGSGFSGSWSTDKNPGPTGDLISGAGLTGSPAQTYRVEIIGKDAAGNYQATSSATFYEFTVDTNAPTAVLASQGNCTGGAGTTSAPDNGLPRNPTRFNCYNINVTGVTFYKYWVGTGNTCPTGIGSYSAQQTAGTNFIAVNNAAWTDGLEYSICVIGSNDGSLYQGTAANSVTRHTVRYDITPPSSQVVTWISPATNLAGKSTVLTDVNVQIGKLGADAVVGYKGTIVTGACPTSATMAADNTTYPERSPETPLQTTGLSAGTVRICFIGRDAAGNYESTTQSVTYTVFAPPAPNDGVAGLDNLYANTFNMTWVTGAGIPADTQEIRLRLCKDSACTEPLPGMSTGAQICNSAVTCAAVSSYTVNTACGGLACIKQINGSDYYGQIKVTDSVGIESSFGTSSSGKRIVGAITGIVRDTNNNALSGATVGLYQSNCTTQIGSDVVTGGTGAFSFALASYVVPITLASSGYCIKASTTGPTRNGIKTFVEAQAGATTDAGSIFAVDTTGKGCILGSLVDGSSGSQLLLSNATFTLKDYAQNTVSGAPSLDPDGKQFAFPASCVTSWGAAPYNSPTFDQAGNGLNAGVYSLQVAVPSYYTITESGIGVTNNTTTNVGYLPMVKTFPDQVADLAGAKQIKVILTWGNQTKDLDLHVVGPASNAFDCQPYNEAAIQNANGASSKFHVYFSQRYCAETGTSAPTGSTNLAVDDSYEYGPEIMNFYTGYVNGTYKFSVYNNDPTALDWNVSKARIYVYAGNYFTGGGGLIKTITNTGSSTLRGWKPFRMTISGTTLNVDDNGGASFGYANMTYGVSPTRSGTRATSGSPNVTALATTSDLTVGMRVTGANITAGATITSINSATSVTISPNPTAAGATTLNFYFNCNGTHINGPSDGLTVNTTVSGVAPADPNLDCGLYLNGTTAAGGAGPLDW